MRFNANWPQKLSLSNLASIRPNRTIAIIISIIIVLLLELFELGQVALAAGSTRFEQPETHDAFGKAQTSDALELNRQDATMSMMSASLLPAYLATSSADFGSDSDSDSKLIDKQHNTPQSLDSRLSDALDQIGPDLRQMRDFSQLDDSLAIDIGLAKRAWQLMRNHAQNAIVSRLQLIGPLIMDNLAKSNVSLECVDAIQQTIDGAKKLDSWAIQRKLSFSKQTKNK